MTFTSTFSTTSSTMLEGDEAALAEHDIGDAAELAKFVLRRKIMF